MGEIRLLEARVSDAQDQADDVDEGALRQRTKRVFDLSEPRERHGSRAAQARPRSADTHNIPAQARRSVLRQGHKYQKETRPRQHRPQALRSKPDVRRNAQTRKPPSQRSLRSRLESSEMMSKAWTWQSIRQVFRIRREGKFQKMAFWKTLLH